MSNINAINTFKQLGSVTAVAASNQSGTYYNGPTNSGVGAQFTYATGALTIDGVSIGLNSYVLFAGQTLAYQNGIYQCIQAGATGVAAILQRRGDFQSIEQMKGGQYCPVSSGTVYAGSIWVLTDPQPAAIGVPAVSGANNIVFVSSAASGAGSYLSIANNLSEIAANGATAQGAALENLGVHSAKYSYAGGATSFTVTDSKITSASVIVGNFQSQATASQVQTIAPGSGSFVVTCSANPGASVFSYLAIAAAE